MFAIIDIETCGGKFEYKRGRITEICIILHDGLTVTETFTTLINPECNISPFYASLSGITNDMVADAPKFHEVAKKIIELTADRIFIAHNVGFDYGFIKEEFASLGYKYKRETLCTVRLSRKLMPGKLSYSLGKLCDSLGIENEARHRAEGDAVATAKLFDILLQLKNMHPQYKNKGVDELMTRRIDKIKQYILNKLPEECGVYYFLDKEQNIIYIGKSTNMYTRAMSHFNSKEHKSKKMLNDLYNVDFVKTGSELIALLLESEEIKKHKPTYNRVRKSHEFTHCIDWFKDENGIVNLKIVAFEESTAALVSFNSYLSARERLESWIDEHILCLRYCGLTDDTSVCFNHQIKKCNGICSGEEEIEAYNKRMQAILERYIYTHASFALVDRGKNDEERSVILIENGCYTGYGYVGEYEQVNSIEDFKNLIQKSTYYPDADDLIKSWMKRNKYKLIPLNKSVQEHF
ncbi:MAG TPA: exonuclease domain-containing protein [Bacteroidia bacterium]|jgi:DNA polymerase-3 subunit epsilon|nr:exonuclease domain-containing protein [Bacteroidia bacterium]